MRIKDVYSTNSLCSVCPISHQLMTERNVRSVFENDPNVTLKQGVELVNISENAESVTITYKDESGDERLSKVFIHFDRR